MDMGIGKYQTLEMVKTVGRKERKPRTAKCFHQHFDNATSEDILNHFGEEVQLYLSLKM